MATTATFRGRYSDGTSAATYGVDVTLTDRGLHIAHLASPEPIVWPYGALRSSVPLSAASEDALLTYDYMTGATLFVADPAFAATLLRDAPQLATSASRWRGARPWIVASAIVLAIGAAIWSSGFSPARTLAGMIPKDVRDRLGKQVVSSMSSGRRQCETPSGRAALDALTERLTEAAETTSKFRVVVVDWGLLNAFAAPGEQIVLTRELIEKARSPDEVAGVLAHEMGHGLELHPETGIVRSIGLAAVLELVTGGGSGSLANIGLMLTQLSYTRAAEREADAHALRMLKGARIATQGIVDFFKRVEEIEGKSGAGRTIGQIDILRSHPQSAERARAAANAPPYAATPALAPSQWEALKAICQK